jgi:hypothetical protein
MRDDNPEGALRRLAAFRYIDAAFTYFYFASFVFELR